MKRKQIITVIIALLAMVFIVGCSSKKEEATKETIKIGGTSISEVSYKALKDEYEKKGYKTEFVMFDANPVVLEAAFSGES